MDIKRVLTTVIGLPIVIILFALNKPIFIDILIAIISIIAIYEYSKCAKNKEYKIISWIGYLYSILIAFRSFIDIKAEYILYSGILTVAILFFHIIFSDGKINFADISYTLFGIIYILGLIVFIPLIYSLKKGNLLIWIVFIAAWGTDTFAYIFGIKIGKHKFTKISPKKSIEGCICGIFGALICLLVYTYFLNNIWGLDFSYLKIAIMAIVLSIMGQIGDLSASAIKRNFDVKDFGNIFPGHGGILDRLDSVIFIAPFVYLSIMYLL